VSDGHHTRRATVGLEKSLRWSQMASRSGWEAKEEEDVAVVVAVEEDVAVVVVVEDVAVVVWWRMWRWLCGGGCGGGCVAVVVWRRRKA